MNQRPQERQLVQHEVRHLQPLPALASHTNEAAFAADTRPGVTDTFSTREQQATRMSSGGRRRKTEEAD